MYRFFYQYHSVIKLFIHIQLYIFLYIHVEVFVYKGLWSFYLYHIYDQEILRQITFYLYALQIGKTLSQRVNKTYWRK